MEAQRRRVTRDSVGLGLAVGAYGVSFGAVAVAAGLEPLQAVALSALAFTGGSQFAYVGVIGAGGSAAAAVTSALLLGTRNTLCGVRLGPLLRLRGPRRLLAAQLTIDETTAMALAQPVEREDLGLLAFWGTGAAVYVCWNVATVLGVLVGQAVDPVRLGLDGAVPAAFLALLWPRLARSSERRVALLAVVLAVGGVLLLPVGLAVPVAALAVLVGLRTRREAVS